MFDLNNYNLSIKSMGQLFVDDAAFKKNVALSAVETELLFSGYIPICRLMKHTRLV